MAVLREQLSELLRVAAPSTADAELLGRFVHDRDQAAFTELLQRHGPWVCGVCRRIATRDADDVFQAVFLSLSRHAHRLRQPQALPAWLHATAVRLALNARRARGRRTAAERRASPRASSDRLDELSARELLQALDDAIGKLPEPERSALILCCLDGLSLDEAAARLGATAGAVKGRLERGRDRLRENLKRHGFAVPAALGASLLLSHGALAQSLLEAAIAVSLGAGVPSPAVAALLRPPFRRLLSAALVIAAITVGTGLLTLGKPIEMEPPPADPPKKHTDVHGDPLPDGAAARLGTERLRAAESSLALSPDGKTIITVSNGSVVREWDLADGRLKSARRLTNQKYWSCALSPDGKWFLGQASRGEDWDKIAIWDLATGRRAFSHKASGGVKSVAFLPDGNAALLLFDDGNGSSVFRADLRGSEWKELFRLPFNSGDHMVLSPDGSKVAVSGNNGAFACWDLGAGKKLWDAPRGPLFAFSPDSRTLVLSPARDQRLELRDAATGKKLDSDHLPPPITAWGDSEGNVSNYLLRFAPDGRGLLFYEHNRGLIVWDLIAGTERIHLPCEFVSNRRSAFTPDGKSLVTLGATLQRWDLATGKPQFLDNEAVGRTRAPDRLAFSPDGGRLLSVWSDGTARVWDVAAGKAMHVWRSHGGRQVSVGSFLPDGLRVVTAGNDGFIRLLDVESGAELQSAKYSKPEDVNSFANDLLLHRDGKFVAALCQGNGRLTRWDLATGKTDSKTVDRMIVAPDLRTAYRTDRQPPTEFRLTDIDSGAVRAVMKTNLPPGGYEFATHSASFSSDSRLFAVKAERSERGQAVGAYVHVWDIAGGQPLASIPAHTLNYVTITFSRDGRLVAFNDLDTVRVWDLQGGRELWHKANAVRSAVSLAFAPDGRSLAAGYDDTTILIWRLPPPEKGKPIPGSERNVVLAALGGDDPKSAHGALWRLVDDPATSVSLLRERLRPPMPPAGKVAQLAEDLGSAEFQKREAADRQLRAFGRSAAGDLRRALAAKPNAEAQRRISAILEELNGERRRDSRAVAVLERIDNSDAIRLLEELAKVGEPATLATEAKEALLRVKRD